jgi:hypothetical protein
VDETGSPIADHRAQAEVVVREDNIDQDELFMLKPAHLNTQVKRFVDFAPVSPDGHPSYHGER